MFKRRDQLSITNRLRDAVWPRMGWGRVVSYYWHRLQRIPGTPSSVAAGFAAGMAASMTPAVGTHTIVALGLAYALRGSLLASVIGTLVVNPWTAAPVWFSTYYAGAFILGWAEYGQAGVSEFLDMFVGLSQSVMQRDIGLFVTKVVPIFWPMLVGSLPIAVIVGFGSYIGLEPILRKFQSRRTMKKDQRATREASDAQDKA